MGQFIRPGTTKIFFVPTIAAPATPTQAELTAGTNLTLTSATNKVSGITGFGAKTNFVETPDFSSRQSGKVAGATTSDDSGLTFYEDTSSNPIRTTLAKDTTGYILMASGGATTVSSKVDVFPIQVAANTKTYAGANAAAEIQVDLAITSVPSLDAVMGS
jgi:hypothetical protein